MSQSVAAPKTETVRISQLNVGDIVRAHGGRWRLVKLNYDQLDNPSRRGHWGDDFGVGNLRNFSTEYLGVSDARWDCAVPPSWRGDWKIQSNELATWTRELAASAEAR